MGGEEKFDQEADDTVILTDEEGVEHQFTVVDVIEVDDKDYMILLPPEEEGDEAVILRIDTDEDGEECLVDIDDEGEWDRVAEAWEELVDEESDEEWEGEEDEEAAEEAGDEQE